MVRLERLHNLADRFVRVRLTRIDELDLRLFEFDHDLTFAVFFFSPKGKIYARYGGRDARGPEQRQSLEGLRYTMSSVLALHDGKQREFAPQAEGPPRFIQQVPGGKRFGQCLHCHQVKEILNEELKGQGAAPQRLAWRYPLPDNLGLLLEGNRGNIVERIAPGSAAARAGLQRGDVLRRLGDTPIHAEADAQFALDRAPTQGHIRVAWERAGKDMAGMIALAEGWRKSDVSWRPSLQMLVPYLPLYGTELTALEKADCKLPIGRFAMRQRSQVHSRAAEAGIQAGDVIVGLAGRTFAGADELREFIRTEYLVGDRVTVHVLRAGQRHTFTLTLP